jgi:ribosome recycling factor
VGIKRHFRASFYLTVALGIVALTIAPFAKAQNRLSDKDVASLMGNLKDDVKSFRPKFNDAVHKSSIRKTSKEKDAKNLVERLQKETEAMQNQFKKTKKSDTELRVVMSTASQVDELVSSLQLGHDVRSRWEKIQTELRQIESAFGM